MGSLAICRSNYQGKQRPLIALSILAVAWFALGGCATEHAQRSLTAQSLLGKSKQEIGRCAGEPLREIVDGDKTVLIYYEEAPEMESSFMGSKSSVRRERPHACRARLSLVANRVEGVEYESIPATFAGEDHCDAIFQACH